MTLGPTGARRARCYAILSLLVASPLVAAAQVSLHVGLGARYSSNLVHDSIVTPLDVRPAIGPALALSADLPLAGPWQLELLADLGTSPLERHDADGSTAEITRLWALGLAVGLRRQLHPWLDGRLAIGALSYLPAHAVGLFSAGSGGVLPYGTLAFDAAPQALARHHLALEVAGDLHKFLTPALRNAGFTDSRVVYRISAGVRVDIPGTR
jgi:hypothetical protein